MKMKRMNTTFNALMMCLLSGSLMIALAQRPGGGGPPSGGPHAGGPPDFIEHMLDLTDAQKAQLKAIHEREADAAKPHHEALKPLMEQAQALTEAATFDETAVRALAAQTSPIQLELHVIHARAQAEVYNLLTPAQRAKLAEMRQKMGERGGGRPGGPGGRPGFGRPGGFGGGFGPPQ